MDIHGTRIRIQRSAALHRDTAQSLVHATFHVLAGRRQIRHSVVDHYHFNYHDPCLFLDLLIAVGPLSLRLSTTSSSDHFLEHMCAYQQDKCQQV